MATATTAASGEVATTQLRLSSGHGPVTRTILRTPPRDASPSEIPLIDVSGIFSARLSERQAVAREIHDTAVNMGFFYIGNHGVPAHVVDEARAAAMAFFRQDLDVKMEADAKQSAFGNGFYAPDQSSINPDEGIERMEAFSFRYDYRLDRVASGLGAVPDHVRLHLWHEDYQWDKTANLPALKKALVQYVASCLTLARALTRAFALSLRLPEDAFDTKVQYPDTSLNLNYYLPIEPPPATAPEESDERVSIGSHTDFQLFTILWQDSTGGLQVLTQEGQWINAKPIEGTFVVNIGDYLQRITNDKYTSTVHRARNCSGRERLSIPFFWGFGLHESCGVLDSCVAPGETAKYEEIKCSEWLKKRLGMKMGLYGDGTEQARGHGSVDLG